MPVEDVSEIAFLIDEDPERIEPERLVLQVNQQEIVMFSRWEAENLVRRLQQFIDRGYKKWEPEQHSTPFGRRLDG